MAVETVEKKEKRKHRRKWNRRQITVVSAAILAGILMVATLIISLADFHVQLNESQELSVEYGSEFVDTGAHASLCGLPVSSDLKGEGQVDTKTVGDYELTYRASFLWRSAETVRRVSVRDTAAPAIELKDTGAYTLPNHKYEEEGFTATDNYDGDVTDKVEVTEEDGKVYYRVADSSGNKAEAVREIRYGDFDAPVITLKGGDTVTVYRGSAFKDPGFTAVDNADGDITDKVKATKNYDTNKLGTYTIEYTVSDGTGNEAKATRKLVVKEPVKQPDVVNPNGKVIYLTFDDGPSSHTPRLLNILKKYNVKATFFVVGCGSQEYLDDIAAGGHSIGLHTMTHNYHKVYASEDAFMDEITTLRRIVKEKAGVDTTLVRFPGGSSNTVSRFNPGIMTRLTKLLTNEGYQYFDWNVSSGDAGSVNTSGAVYNNVVNGVRGKNMSIVLQHDSKGFSVDAVERIIQWGLANGYTFLPLTPSSPTVHHGINN